jgi:hypothetical protein
LGGFELIQSWQSFVYHLTARGGQFQHGKLTKDYSQKSKEWQKLMENSTREFFRKWGTAVNHDEYMLPIVSPKYDIGFVVDNCSTELLTQLEPWCSDIYGDWIGHKGFGVNKYIEEEQKKTTIDLSKKIHSNHFEPKNDVVVKFDCNKLNNHYFQILVNLPEILQDSGEVNEVMEYDIFEIVINSLKTYEKDLIKCDV